MAVARGEELEEGEQRGRPKQSLLRKNLWRQRRRGAQRNFQNRTPLDKPREETSSSIENLTGHNLGTTTGLKRKMWRQIEAQKMVTGTSPTGPKQPQHPNVIPNLTSDELETGLAVPAQPVAVPALMGL